MCMCCCFSQDLNTLLQRIELRVLSTVGCQCTVCHCHAQKHLMLCLATLCTLTPDTNHTAAAGGKAAKNNWILTHDSAGILLPAVFKLVASLLLLHCSRFVPAKQPCCFVTPGERLHCCLGSIHLGQPLWYGLKHCVGGIVPAVAGLLFSCARTLHVTWQYKAIH